ncbi:MAG: hypothetical protein ACI90V_006677 [Bacillariaceae sp.]|jgi:hypothetical protein
MVSSVSIKSYVGVSIILLLLIVIAPLFSINISSGSAPAPRATPDMMILTSINDDPSFISVRGGGRGGGLDRKSNQSTIKETVNDDNDDIEIDDIQAATTLKTTRTRFLKANDYDDDFYSFIAMLTTRYNLSDDTKVSEEVIVYLIPFKK